MKQIAIGLLVPLLASSVAAFAQVGTGAGLGFTFANNNLSISTRSDPPSASANLRYSPVVRSRAVSRDASYFIRYLVDRGNHVFFGYELLVQRQASGEYQLTFGKLGVTAIEMAVEYVARLSPRVAVATNAPLIDPGEWTCSELPILPDPRVVHEGDTISVELFEDSSSGEKLIDDIQILAGGSMPGPLVPPIVQPVRTTQVPTAPGEAREFTAADAILMLAQPQVSVNGTVTVYPLRGGRTAQGSLVWIYLPKRGRYIFSIAPHEGLDFKRTGEIRGGVVLFNSGADSIKVECPNRIASGDAAYHLYVLHDPEWEPTAANQKGMFEIGSVSVSELVAVQKE